MLKPAFGGYFADPFVLRLDDGSYAAYGSSGAGTATGLAFEALTSPDLISWQTQGPVLARPPYKQGDQYWAPEVIYANGYFWMYYSVGHGIIGHHLRVARSPSPLGPFVDEGVDLTPSETFAIDPHPYQDIDGSRYLFFARDVLDAARPGTHLAAARLATMTSFATAPTAILEPNADWQIYEPARTMYGQIFDWHTLEGPSVLLRGGRYWLTYSGGAWTGPNYAVSWAVADHPLGPWEHAPTGTPPLLATTDDLIGPGHNSLTTTPDGADVIAFHSWDAAHHTRQMHLHTINFDATGPLMGAALNS